MSADWLIFSFEHDAFWRANSRGYTRNIAEAGRYEYEDARVICEQADFRGQMGLRDLENEPPPEIMMNSPEARERGYVMNPSADLFARLCAGPADA